MRDLLYRRAATNDPSGLYKTDDGQSRLSNDENYIRWTNENGKIILHKLFDDRQDTVPVDDRT